MAAGLGAFLLYVYQNNATPAMVVPAPVMGFGSGTRYRTPATTASRGSLPAMKEASTLMRLQAMKRNRRMR